MLLIRCPWCGPRDETEFRYGGQAHLAYPADPEARWAERWAHAAGCRRWFNAIRDTATHRVIATYRQGEEPPA